MASGEERWQEAVAAASAGLSPRMRETIELQAAGMPAPVMRAFAGLMALAAEHGLEFRVESARPEPVVEFVRYRRIRCTFDIEEERIVARLQHTLRHPSWLPEPQMPAAVEEVGTGVA